MSREPIDLVIAKGKKHLSKQEIEERRASEIKVPFVDVVAPSYLNKKQQTKFYEVASMLLELNLLTELDVDCLGRWVTNQDLYVTYTKAINKALREEDTATVISMQRLQQNVHSQIVKDERALGLNIASRLAMSKPADKQEDDKPKNKFAKFEKRAN